MRTIRIPSNRHILGAVVLGGVVLGAGLAVAASGMAAEASGPDGHEAHAEQTVLARAKVEGAYRMAAPGSTDLLTVEVTIPAHSQIPWHRALGATLVSVRSGVFTLQSATPSGCLTKRYRSGTGVVVPTREVHRGRNTGKDPVRLLVTYAGIPAGAEPEEGVNPPASCR